MELDELRAFVTVVQVGSITGAARRLYRSQTAVTRQVQALEHDVGAPLLDRRSRPLVPTALGRAVLEHARRALAAVDDLKGAAATLTGEPSGELRIGVGHSLVEVLMRARLAAFRRAFPRLALAVTAGWSQDLVALLRDGALDAGLLLLPRNWTPSPPLEARALAVEEVVVIAPRSARLRSRVDLEALRGARWVLNPEGCLFRSALRQALAAAGQPLVVAAETHGGALQIGLVAAGLGLGLVPLHSLRVHARRRAVRAISLRQDPFAVAIWLVSGKVAPTLEPALGLLADGVRRVLDRRRLSPPPSP